VRPFHVYLIVLLAGLPCYLLLDGLSQRLFFYVYGFSSVGAILIGLRVHRPDAGPWLAFAGAMLLFALGDVAFDLYALHNGVAPVPSVADVLYVAGYPVLAFGMVLLVRHRVPGRDLVSAIDGAIVAIGVGAVAWAFVVSPYAARNELGLSTRLVSIAYPVFDLLVLAVMVRLLLSGGRRSVAYSLVAASVLVLLVTDGFYTVATMHDTYQDGSVIDLGWMLSYALFGAAALHSSMHVATTWRSAPRRPPVRRVLFLLGVAALSPIALLIFEDVRRSGNDVLAVALCSAAILVLVFARVAVLTGALDRAFLAQTRAVSREHALTGAGLAMLTARDTQVIADAAVRAAVVSASPDAWALFACCDFTGPRIIATTGSGAPEALDEDIGALLDRDELLTRPIRVLDADARAARAVRIVVPVTVAMMLRAVIVVGDVGIDAQEYVPTLALLASEVALALDANDSDRERQRVRTEHALTAAIRQSSI